MVSSHRREAKSVAITVENTFICACLSRQFQQNTIREADYIICIHGAHLEIEEGNVTHTQQHHTHLHNRAVARCLHLLQTLKYFTINHQHSAETNLLHWAKLRKRTVTLLYTASPSNGARKALKRMWLNAAVMWLIMSTPPVLMWWRLNLISRWRWSANSSHPSLSVNANDLQLSLGGQFSMKLDWNFSFLCVYVCVRVCVLVMKTPRN